MTETTPPEPSPAPTHQTDVQLQPGDVLMHLVVTLLTPFFLAATNGNLGLARLAAFETVNAFRLDNHVDLLAVAQIVGAGLASLGALSRSMDDDLPLAQILLLHNDAAALDRVSQHNRRALRNSSAETAPYRRNKPAAAEPAAEPAADARYEAAVVADLARTRHRLAEVQSALPNPSSPQDPAQAAEPIPSQAQTTAATPTPDAATPTVQPTPAASAIPPARSAPFPATQPAPAGVPPITDRERQALWAAAMTEVAGEYTASAPFLPAAERRQASQRAAALSSTAHSLLCAHIPPVPQPGALNPPSRPTANPKRC